MVLPVIIRLSIALNRYFTKLWRHGCTRGPKNHGEGTRYFCIVILEDPSGCKQISGYSLWGVMTFLFTIFKKIYPLPPQSPVFIYILIFCNDHDSAFSSRIIENPNEIRTEESFSTISLLSDRKKIVTQYKWSTDCLLFIWYAKHQPSQTLSFAG